MLGRLALAALLINAERAVAQATITGDEPRDTLHAQTQAPFFTKKDALLGVGFVIGTVAMFPLDENLAGRLQTHQDRQGFLQNASKGVEVIASPGAYFIGGGLYVFGRLAKYDRVADLGWHGTEAVLLAEGVTYTIKGLAGRARPFLSSGTDADALYFGKGFRSGDFSSFPSGHSTTAFAAAAAVTNETTRWWPRSTWVVGPLMYTGAAAVGLSRMYHNRHWASDVVMGAAIGTFTGRKVVQYSHGHPDNVLDRILLRVSLVPDGYGGKMVMLTLPAP
ncbi:MAG TPA: phosphatase PAP2 family protein [Gemmatimonadaceae bacterium]|jgi:membrane-associated phospholipid phosphatase